MIRGKISAPKTLPAPADGETYCQLGEVGHADDTPMYCWVDQHDYVMVEVTLRPSGDEVICRLDTGALESGGFYLPLHYGAKVVVVFPGGTGEQGVIVGRLNDKNWPFPATVCDMQAKGAAGQLPMFAFLKTDGGQMLAIETGPEGDVLVHSGASLKLQTDPDGQILLNGRTHIGEDFLTPPVGDSIGPAGDIVIGTPGVPHEPLPGTNVNLPPALPVGPNGVPWPADGIVRYKDQMQSNITADPAFWAWVIAVTAAITAMAAPFNVTPAGTPVVSLGTGAVVPPVPPTTLTSWPASCALHTCSDE